MLTAACTWTRGYAGGSTNKSKLIKKGPRPGKKEKQLQPEPFQKMKVIAVSGPMTVKELQEAMDVDEGIDDEVLVLSLILILKFKI